MSLNKTPSYVGVKEKGGGALRITIAGIPSWYSAFRCDDCLDFKKRPEFVRNGTRTIAYCERMEAEEPCEITGIRYEGEKK